MPPPPLPPLLLLFFCLTGNLRILLRLRILCVTCHVTGFLGLVSTGQLQICDSHFCKNRSLFSLEHCLALQIVMLDILHTYVHSLLVKSYSKLQYSVRRVTIMHAVLIHEYYRGIIYFQEFYR